MLDWIAGNEIILSRETNVF